LNPGSVADRRVLALAFCRADRAARWRQANDAAPSDSAPRQDHPLQLSGSPAVLTAAELLTNAAEHGGPVEFARIATLIRSSNLYPVRLRRYWSLIMSKIIFLIPSYQPTALFCELLEEFRQMDPSPVVVVDDGSDSAYSELFQRAARVRDIVILKNAVNLGKGAALKHGMNHVLVNYPDCMGVVTADADGQHAADDILKVATELRSRSTEVIFGSRDFKRDVPFRSKIGNVVSHYVYRLLVGLNLTDTQTGLRGVPRRLMELSLGIHSNRYEFETEQIIAAKAAGFKFTEVPIRTLYIDNNSSSHFHPILDSFRIYFVLLRYALSSIATALTDLIMFYILTANGMALLSANMSARAVALWLQFVLLKKYVFKSKAGMSIFAAYVAYVFFSGYLSAAMQAQFAEHFFVSSLLAKVVVESVIWIFNFMFLRDIIFRK
jgi:glycosyltransferase involved in cell wall biosynthesis